MEKTGRKKKDAGKEELYYAQDLIGIDDIRGNTIFMHDGTICGILEILPVNFFHKPVTERNYISDGMERLFRICPGRVHIKVRTEDTNIEKTIEFIRQCNKDETDGHVLAQMDDYIANIRMMQRQQTICQKFYLIFEYSGNANGERSTSVEEICRQMYQSSVLISNAVKGMGNFVLEFNREDEETWHVLDILYEFFNPNSSAHMSVEQRVARIDEDAEKYNASVGPKKKKSVSVSDYIAPRGIDFTHKDFLIMDGQYQTFLSFRDNGYPVGALPAGWVNNVIGRGKGIDIDMVFSRNNREQVLATLSQYNRISMARANTAVNNPDKFENMATKIQNIHYVTDKMKNSNEDLYDVCIIVSIRRNSYQDMMSIKDQILSYMRSNDMYMNDSYLTVRQYFSLVMPVLRLDRNMLTSVFARDRHSFLTSSLCSLYCFTAYELFDGNGLIIGQNPENNTLVSFNNFNRRRYANGNICIIGSSGSGKTFTEQMLAYRMRLSDIRTIIIAPVKGRVDYYPGCENIGGSFITLSPKSPTCINIMEIRPAANLTDEELEEAAEETEGGRTSLLSQRITSVTTFIQLLLGREEMTITEETMLSVELTRLYNAFGITENDLSIWKDRKRRIVKDMPIIRDLYNRLEFVPELQRIRSVLAQCVMGDCRSLNGRTNVDLSNKYIVFDVDGNAITERLQPAFLYIAFDCAYSMAQESTAHKDAVFMDEVWKMMINEACAKQVKSMVKLIRAYNACVILATQDLEDFLHSSGGFGSAVLNNTQIKMFLRMNDQEIDLVTESMHFSEDDRKTLKELNHEALIYSGTDKIICSITASPKETAVFSSKPRGRGSAF